MESKLKSQNGIFSSIWLTRKFKINAFKTVCLDAVYSQLSPAPVLEQKYFTKCCHGILRMAVLCFKMA